MIHIKAFNESDIGLIVGCFAEHQWEKPATTFQTYFSEQCLDERQVWLAFDDTAFAGYVTLKWQSAYLPLFEQNIPEIMDLNVLPPYRKKGIATRLLDFAEIEAMQRSERVGLGVGLYPDYGSAQKLYISRGYKPDGLGITYRYQRVNPGDSVCLDDDLILWFTKQLKPKSQ